VDVLWRDVRRNQQLEALRLSTGAWSPADHPELVRGGAAFVAKIRAEADERFQDAMSRQDHRWPRSRKVPCASLVEILCILYKDCGKATRPR
jgi:hypothetical protein